jgi:endonuclease-3 related protein
MRAGSDLLPIYQTLHKAFGPQHWWPGDNEFEMMTGAVLTQNTSWRNVEKALKNLKEQNSLIMRKLHRMSVSKLAHFIRPAGYFNLKAKRLKALIRWLKQTCAGRIHQLKKLSAETLRGMLLGVYGIGPETADSILVYAFKKKSFVIDAYTKRIFSRHGFLKETSPYETFKDLFEKALPKKIKIYNEYHALIVKIGKDFCRKIPKCSTCPLESDLMKFKNALMDQKKDRIKLYA